MVIGVLRLELAVHQATSLKAKRSVIRKVVERCRNRFPVSCAETGLQDLRRRSQLGFAVVTDSKDFAHDLFERIEREVESVGLAEIVDRFVEFLHYD